MRHLFGAVALCTLSLASCRQRTFQGSQTNQNEDGIEQCKSAAGKALKVKYPDLNLADFEFELQFDCHEASLITSLDDEVSTSNRLFQQLNDLGDRMPVPLVKRTFDLLNPYCRADNEIYGAFCMAGDISAAKTVTQSENMLKALPKAVLALAKALEGDTNVNLVETVLRLPEFSQNKIEGVLLAGFLGLDDNGVQTNRLKANLAFLKRWDDYANVFPYLSQYSQFPAQGGDKPTEALMHVLFSTRMGRAIVPGLGDTAKQTYKTYAGVYVGCRHAQLKTPKAVALRESQDVGYLYQIIKLRQSFGKPWQEFLKDTERYDAAGKETGYLMRTGAEYGYTLCTPEG